MNARSTEQATATSALAALVLLTTFGEAAAQGTRPSLHRIAVRSCGTADSLVGPLEDTRAWVRGSYDPRSDSTWLVSGDMVFSTHAMVTFPGRRLIGYPAAQLNVVVREQAARLLLSAPDPLPTSLVLDDSVVLQPTVVVKGTYVGPGEPTVAPIIMGLRDIEFLQLARARRALVNIDDIKLRLGKETLRDIAALYRVALCAEIR